MPWLPLSRLSLNRAQSSHGVPSLGFLFYMQTRHRQKPITRQEQHYGRAGSLLLVEAGFKNILGNCMSLNLFALP